MLQSYSDEKYISDDYATDLSKARAVAVEMERISDDPPDRVAAWVATVSDEQIRRLDQQVLGDLLVVETRRDDWRKVHGTGADAHRAAGPGRRPAAGAGAARHAAPAVARPVVGGRGRRQRRRRAPGRRRADDPPGAVHPPGRRGRAAAGDAFCLSLGKPVAGRLVDAILAEETARGPSAGCAKCWSRSARRPSASRRAVRRPQPGGPPDRHRAAARCRRRRGAAAPGRAARRRRAAGAARGAARDHADGHRRGLHGAPDGAHLRAGRAPARRSCTRSGTLRDERAAPLFAFIVRQSDHRGDSEAFYLSALETLGHLGASSERDAAGAARRARPRGMVGAGPHRAACGGGRATALRAIGSPEA